MEKDRGYTWNKNQEKKFSRSFLANFLRGLSFYGADCILPVAEPPWLVVKKGDGILHLLLVGEPLRYVGGSGGQVTFKK